MKKLLVFFIVGLLIFSILGVLLYQSKNIESYQNEETITIFVITLKQEKRLINIEKQEKKLGEKIIMHDAVKGDLLDIDQLINEGLISEASYKDGADYRKREIGCYMSHISIYNNIKKNNENDGYTIVFEDDFNINTDNFIHDVDTIIKNINNNNIDFDIIFLGNINSNKGDRVIDNIFKVNKNDQLLGTHGYLINNKNIDKIIDETKFIDMPIDIKLDNLSKSKQLNIYVVHPTIVDQSGSDYSSIRDMNIETFVNNFY
jgi:GR25 family glycosyltransferase involved in LPS biosynthesis